jgi:O-antigen/teichoic acid export membrane protein
LIILNGLFTIIVLLVYYVLIYKIDKFTQNYQLYLIGSLLILSNIFLVEWFFQGIGNFKFIAIRTIIIRIISLVFILLLVKNKNNTNLYFTILAGTNILNCVVNYFYAIFKFKLVFRYTNFKRHIKPLSLIFASILSISIYIILDTIMLGFLSDDNSVGLYSTAIRISKVPIYIITSLGVVLIPKLSQLYSQGEMGKFINLINKSIEFVITLSIPTLFFIFLLSDEIIYCFAGKDFSDASITLKLVSPLMLIIGLSNIFGVQVLTSISKDAFFTISVLSGMIFNIIFNLILIKHFRHNGAAFVNVFTEIIVTFMTFIFAQKFVKFKLNMQMVLKVIFISSLLVPISILINSIFLNPFQRIIFNLISTCMILILIIFKITKQDILIKYLQNFYKNGLSKNINSNTKFN